MGTWYVLPEEDYYDDIELMRSGLGDWGHKFIDKVRTASGKWRYIYEDAKNKIGNIGHNIRQKIIHKKAMDRIAANRGTNKATSNAQYRAAKATADRIRQERVEAGNRRRAARISSQLRTARHDSDTRVDPRNPAITTAYGKNKARKDRMNNYYDSLNALNNPSGDAFAPTAESQAAARRAQRRKVYATDKRNRETKQRNRDYLDSLNALNNPSGDAFAASARSREAARRAEKQRAANKAANNAKREQRNRNYLDSLNALNNPSGDAFAPRSGSYVTKKKRSSSVSIGKRRNSPAKGHKARKTWMGTKA